MAHSRSKSQGQALQDSADPAGFQQDCVPRRGGETSRLDPGSISSEEIGGPSNGPFLICSVQETEIFRHHACAYGEIVQKLSGKE